MVITIVQHLSVIAGLLTLFSPADEAVLLAVFLEVLVKALYALHEEAKPDLRLHRSRPRFRRLEAYWMTQFSLSMHVVRTLRCLRVSHTLVAWCITKVSLTRKSFGGLILPMVPWDHSTRVYDDVGTNAGRQKIRIFKSLLLGLIVWL